MNRLVPVLPLLLMWTLAAQATTPAVAQEIALDADAMAADAAASDLATSWARDLAFDDERGTVRDADRIDSLQAGLAVVGFHEAGNADKAVRQADFLLSLQGGDGSVPNGATVRGRKIVPDEDPCTLAAQSAAIRGFLAAWDVTKDEKYRSAARKSYLYVQGELWAPQAGVYRGHEGARSTTYDPILLGTTVGAFRDLAEAHEGDVREEFAGRLQTLWAGVSAAGDPSQGVTIDTRR